MKHIKSIFIPPIVDENPYQNQLIDNLQKLGTQIDIQKPGSSPTFFFPIVISHWKPDVIHLHWLEPSCIASNLLKSILKSLAFIVQLAIFRLVGIKIVWTVHNLKNHENLNLVLNRICTHVVIKLSHAIITHCEAAKEELFKAFPVENKDKVFVVPHGNYTEWYENTVERTIARETLNLKNGSPVFLFLGLIRRYKGVPELIEAFKGFDSDEMRLVIAGKVSGDDQELTNLIVQKIGDDKRISFIPSFVEAEKVQLYMNAADVVVFPYRDILTSGAVMLALSFGRACIAPRKGCIAEVLDDNGAFLYDMNDENGLMQAINSALESSSELLIMGQHNQRLSQKYNWSNIAELTLDVYRSCL